MYFSVAVLAAAVPAAAASRLVGIWNPSRDILETVDDEWVSASWKTGDEIFLKFFLEWRDHVERTGESKSLKKKKQNNQKNKAG